MNSAILYLLTSIGVVTIFVFRKSIWELYVGAPMWTSIIVGIMRKDCTLADLTDKKRYRAMSRDWALNYFRSFIQSSTCQDFVAKHAAGDHTHIQTLWCVGNAAYVLNIASGEVMIVYPKSGLVFLSTPDFAVSVLHDHCPLVDPFAKTVHALFYVKHVIDKHDRFPENFHDIVEA